MNVEARVSTLFPYTSQSGVLLLKSTTRQAFASQSVLGWESGDGFPEVMHGEREAGGMHGRIEYRFID